MSKKLLDQPISRREFFKLSGTTGAVLALDIIHGLPPDS